MRKNKNNIFIIYSFLGSDFEQNVHSATIGFGTYSKTFKLSDWTIVNCFILDTGGTEEWSPNSLSSGFSSRGRRFDGLFTAYQHRNRRAFCFNHRRVGRHLPWVWKQAPSDGRVS